MYLKRRECSSVKTRVLRLLTGLCIVWLLIAENLFKEYVLVYVCRSQPKNAPSNSYHHAWLQQAGPYKSESLNHKTLHRHPHISCFFSCILSKMTTFIHGGGEGGGGERSLVCCRLSSY